MKSEDIQSIISEYNPSTMSACYKSLSRIPFFEGEDDEKNLKVLLECFFKENVTALASKNGYETTFLEIANDLIDMYIKVADGSRESKYLALIRKTAASKNERRFDLDEAVLVIASLFRSCVPLHNGVPKEIQDVDFCLYKEDADVFASLYETMGLRKILYTRRKKGIKAGIREARVPTLPETTHIYSRNPPRVLLAVKAKGALVVHAGTVIRESLKIETEEKRVYYSEDDKQFFFVLGTSLLYGLLQYGEENG